LDQTGSGQSNWGSNGIHAQNWAKLVVVRITGKVQEAMLGIYQNRLWSELLGKYWKSCSKLGQTGNGQQCSPHQFKKGRPAPLSCRKGCLCPSLKKKKNDPQVILSTSKCLKITPYAIKML
jgi:hypothetical protein